MKRIMKTQWFWMVVGVLMWVGGYGQPCLEDDYVALRALYLSTGGDNWTDNTNWPDSVFFDANPTLPLGINMDTWYGINMDSGCVSSVWMGSGADTGNNLTGTIPKELGSLSNLTSLLLAWNNLSGSIPPELGNLSNLRYITLCINGLTGSIPKELGNLDNLETLWLCKNNLTGGIPKELGNLNRLKLLYLNHNELSGNIPSELGNLDSLGQLSLHENQLTGNIPSSFGDLDDLYLFLAGYNNLSGCYHSNLLNLCDVLSISIDLQNNFDIPWDCFCDNGVCTSLSIDALSPINPSCENNDGSIALTIDATSGLPPFKYIWSNGDTTPILTNLSEGTYIVTVSDAESCNGILVDSITISVPPPPVIENTQTTNALCDNDGTLSVDVSSGTPPYEYSVNGSNFQSENDFTLAAGNYGVVVRDLANCVTNESVVIGDDTPVVSLGTDSYTCEPPNRILDAGYSDAEWSTGEIAQTITVNDYGTYSVTVTDADCEVTDEIILEDVIQFFATTVDTMIARGEYVGIGLSGADSYEWTPKNDLYCVTSNCDSVRIQPDFSTEYTVTASTDDGCEKDFRIWVGIGGPSVLPPGGVLFFPELEGDNFLNNQLSVYNRSGVQVFHAQPYDNTWDGTYNGQALPTGNYYYLLELDVTANNVIKQRLFISR